MKDAVESFTDAALNIAAEYDDVGEAQGIAEHVLEDLLPRIDDVGQLMVLPAGSLLLSHTGVGWVRTPHRMTPWQSVDSGGFGSSVGDLREITERLVKFQAPFRLVWVP